MGTKPTISDVAKRAGMSKTAVSFVFNDRPGISDESRRRILAAAEELGWQPDGRARALVRKRTGALGLIIRREPVLLTTDPFFPQFVAGVEIGLAEFDYALMLQVILDEKSEQKAYTDFAREARVDGVFLVDLTVRDVRIPLVQALKLPAAILGPKSLEVPGTVAVEANDESGVRRAVHHLRSLGHTNIGHITGVPRYIHTQSRRQAWAETLEGAGLRPGPVITSDFTGVGGTKATHEMLDLPNPPTAIVYGNDLMAIAGISAASDRGLSVPRDLSIVGFDDVPLAPYVSPPLTTVRQDAVEWGQSAAINLIALVEGREPQWPSPPPAELIVRNTTGPAPTR